MKNLFLITVLFLGLGNAQNSNAQPGRPIPGAANCCMAMRCNAATSCDPNACACVPNRVPRPTPTPVQCSVPSCPAPPQGCNYGPPHFDHHGCQIDCGNLICPTATPPCPVPSCPAPPPNCRYGSPRFDFNGCQQGCGQLICTE